MVYKRNCWIARIVVARSFNSAVVYNFYIFTVLWNLGLLFLEVEIK